MRIKRRPLGCWAWLGVMVALSLLEQVLPQVLAYTVSRWAVGAVVVIVAVVAGIRKVRGGWSVRQAWSRARARVDTPGKLRVAAPTAAAWVTVVSFPAVILALVAAPSHASRVFLPPAVDARLQLWIIVVAVAVGFVGIGCWFGFGACVWGLADGGFTATIVAVTIALAAAAPLLILSRETSRPVWLALIATQIVWQFASAFLCSAVSVRRKRQLLLS